MVYLLHFDRPVKHARHLITVAHSSFGAIGRRVSYEQLADEPLVRAARAAGVTLTIARVWDGGEARARQLRHTGGSTRMCPVCGLALAVEA